MSDPPPPMRSAALQATNASLRLDKWLWYARFFKTRTLATRICGEGRIRVDGERISKAHIAIRPGQVLSFVKENQLRVIRIRALGSRRGPAMEAQALYEDLSPPPQEGSKQMPDAANGLRDAGLGRPTKKDRRAVDRLRRESR